MKSYSKRIPFQFDDDLNFQRDAINSVVELFNGVSRQDDNAIYKNLNKIKKFGEGDPVRNPQIVKGTRLLNNLRDVQLKNMLFVDNELMEHNFTVEMETGTGKTYVYLRTILELYKTYGLTKFMIVVPSIAIRKGVEKSIDMLRDHFKALYDGLDLKNHSFVYDSGNLKKISSGFVETRDLSIAVMNIQMFNQERNKLRQSDEYGQVLWEDIKYISSVVIIDEPQKMEGAGRKKSASLEAIEMLNPLFILRYSATHRKLFNQVYKLDSYDAFKNDLVKKIEVKTVHGTIPKDYPYIRYIEFTRDLYARLEIFCVEQGGIIRKVPVKVRGGYSLHEASGELDQYKNIYIQEDPHKLKKLKIADQDKVFELSVGENNYKMGEDEVIRIQIKLAIKSHFEKQLKILKKGLHLKVISLFFIDSVDKVRDNTAADGRGEYLRIFDEEYARLIKDPEWDELFKGYPRLFKEYQNIPKVREGYFAIDKKSNIVDVEGWESTLDEQKLKKKAQEDVDRGIELILEKKDELISFDEPLAFVFSHSALREGWDNPNVFTLCTLKRGGSEIAKKQEIGRGLRLPVMTDGNRCTDKEVNELTVIANDYYDRFAESLQKDFNEQAGFNKDEVTAEIIFTTLQSAGLPKEKLTPELVDTFRNELLHQKFINDKNALTKGAKDIHNIEFKDETLKEHSIMIKEKFAEYMLAKGTKKIPVKNGDEPPVENGPHSYISEEQFKKLIREISKRIRKRTMYQVDIDSAGFIQDCAAELNEFLKYKRLREAFEVETGKAGFDEHQKFVMNEAEKNTHYIDKVSETGRAVPAGDAGNGGAGLLSSRINEEPAGELEQQKSEFEVINYIMYHTMLPRLAIYRIISRLDKKELLKNQDILDAVTQLIKDRFTECKAGNITGYKIIDGYVFSDKTIFEADPIDAGDLDDASKHIYPTKESRRRALHKFYKLDNDGEVTFAKGLDGDDNVLLYTKIKKGGFVIDTPYGEYSPDWAVIYKGDDKIARLYFIIETKIKKEWSDLSDVEKIKIECGELHFKAVADDVRFKWANSHDDFKDNRYNANRKG